MADKRDAECQATLAKGGAWNLRPFSNKYFPTAVSCFRPFRPTFSIPPAPLLGRQFKARIVGARAAKRTMGRGRGARVENTRRARAVLAVVVTLVIGLGCRGGRREDGERIVSSASLADVEAVFGREALYGKRRTRHTSHISGTYGTYDQHSHHDHHGIRHKSTEPGRSHVSDPPYDARRAASYFATMAKYKAAGLDGLGGRTVRTGDSRVRRTKALPSGKLAFMFLTDKVMPGWEAWGTFFATASDDEYNVYVNANPGVANAQKGIFANKVIKHSIATTWGTFSIVEATIGLLRHALAQDTENERFILVSDNTLPVASFQSVRCTLLAERRSLINACDLTKHDREAKVRIGPFPDPATLFTAPS